MDCAVRSCCGFFSLQSGTTAVGILSMIRGSLGFHQAYSNMDLNVHEGFINKFSIAEIKTILTTMPISWIILSAITVSVTIPLLIVAWKNRNPECLLPWLVLEPFLTFTGIGFASKDFISSILAGQQHRIDSASSITAIVIIAAVDLYSCLVVYNYYRQLRKTRNGNWSKPDVKIQVVLHEEHISYYGRHIPEYETSPCQIAEPLISHWKT